MFLSVVLSPTSTPRIFTRISGLRQDCVPKVTNNLYIPTDRWYLGLCERKTSTIGICDEKWSGTRFGANVEVPQFFWL